MKTGIPIIGIIVLSLVIFVPHASACSCAAEWNIEDDFAENDNVIFSGKVINIKEQQRTFLVTFEIDQSWKGIPDDITDIITMTSQSSSTCGYNFTANQSYLVEAYGKWDQTPNVSLCDSTTLLDFAHEQISFLNKQTQNDDTDFTAATFTDKYKDLLQKGGARVSVLIKVTGDVESTDPTKRAKEIRNLQSYVLKFLSYTNGVNILSNPQKNEITGQIHPHWIEILEKRTDVLSVTILDSDYLSNDRTILTPLKQQKNGVPANKVECRDGLYRGFSESNGKAICATGYTISELIHRGWAESHTAISSATISRAGDAVRDYCPEGTQLTQGGWYVPFEKNPHVEQVSVHELYDPEYDSQGVEFILNPLSDLETYGKTMVFVFVDCDLSFDYFEVLILPNTIEQRKNFVVHYPTTTTNTIHFDNQDGISYKIDGRTDSGVGSGDFTVWIDAQNDWFIEETAGGYEEVSRIELSASNPETGEVYDWMNYIIYLTQEIAD